MKTEDLTEKQLRAHIAAETRLAARRLKWARFLKSEGLRYDHYVRFAREHSHRRNAWRRLLEAR